ncbi:MAG: site-2 protease family protein [Chloroflexota bacterium]|nr:site-2 protease family protein [Chloroflexota bacterium]MDQ6906499.1 site-2 protease family protein [Chloroflexota bacterium]
MFGRTDINPQVFVSILLAFVISITIHEFAHAYTATLLGDPTPREQGRVTLNPMSHLDPIGFLFLVFVALTGFGLGWGKPVQFNPYRMRWGKHGVALVAAAGPISNVILALVFAVPQRVFATGFHTLPPNVQTFVTILVTLNLALAAFNLIPLPPLDGLKILTGILPDFWYPILARLDQYGFVLLFLVIFFQPLRPVLFNISAPVYETLTRLIEGASGVFGSF